MILTPKIQIAVCDDEISSLETITHMTIEILQTEGILYDITTYNNGKELLSAIRKGKQFQILLLDVIMDGMDGIELAKILREARNDSAIIFISYNREMALRGYEVAATRYLAKPLDSDLMREALLFCCHTIENVKKVLLNTTKGHCEISLSKIVYAETWNRATRLILTDGPLETTVRISELAELLPAEQFILCHRTILVNLAYVRYITGHELELNTGEHLPVSKYRLPELKDHLIQYLNS